MFKRWLRRLRGVFGIGTLWGAVGVGIGGVVSVLMSVSSGNPALSTLLAFCLGAGSLGFVLGSTFAAYVAVLERRRTVDDLTLRRGAGWGALAGGTVVLVGLAFLAGFSGWGAGLSVGYRLLLLASAAGSYAALTAGLAAGTVALAKRAPADLKAARSPDDSHLLGDL